MGGSSLFALNNVAKSPPPPRTVSCHVWQSALQPDVSGVASTRPDIDWCTVTGCIRIRFHTRRSRRASFHTSYPVCAGPWPSPGSLICGSLFRRRERHLTMYQLTVFQGLLRVSFADDVTMLGVVSASVCPGGGDAVGVCGRWG